MSRLHRYRPLLTSLRSILHFVFYIIKRQVTESDIIFLILLFFPSLALLLIVRHIVSLLTAVHYSNTILQNRSKKQ